MAGPRPPSSSSPSPPAAKANIVRCPIHGLSYNRDRTAGCLRCPDPARDRAQALERTRLAHSWRWSDIRRDPSKRAIVGLALALVIGFLPAAYTTFAVSGGEVRRIRARQAELSEQPGTSAVLDEFDRLEGAIARVRRRGLQHSAVLWVLVTAIAAVGFDRLAPREPALSDGAGAAAGGDARDT
jgi:hypothetical protein